MGRTRRPTASVRVQQVRARIEGWRKTRMKRSPMPEPLWEAAVELTRCDGVHPISRALQLNYQSLKCRVALASGVTSGRRGAGVARGFVELSSPLPIAPPSPVGLEVELSGSDGAKLTIRLPAERALDVERLAEAFLGRGRR